MDWIVYTSVSDADLGHDQIFEIVQTSARNNPAREITGFLLYDKRRFFQMIEGPGDGLDDLMTTLRQDKRHHSISVVARGTYGDRLFPRWRMNRIANDAQMSDVKQTFTKVPSADELRGYLDDFLAA